MSYWISDESDHGIFLLLEFEIGGPRNVLRKIRMWNKETGERRSDEENLDREDTCQEEVDPPANPHI